MCIRDRLYIPSFVSSQKNLLRLQYVLHPVQGVNPDKPPLAVVDPDRAVLRRGVSLRLIAVERIAVMDQLVKFFLHRKSRIL